MPDLGNYRASLYYMCTLSSGMTVNAIIEDFETFGPTIWYITITYRSNCNGIIFVIAQSSEVVMKQ